MQKTFFVLTNIFLSYVTYQFTNHQQNNCFAEKICLTGVKSGYITDSQMSASSQWEEHGGHEPHVARLDGSKGWVPENSKISITIA